MPITNDFDLKINHKMFAISLVNPTSKAGLVFAGLLLCFWAGVPCHSGWELIQVLSLGGGGLLSGSVVEVWWVPALLDTYGLSEGYEI